ncbi:hypothetical protein FA15DRAFT_273524 [Coprinopsis marcescibilis]|uniref:Uncharacterized protein n=1 Tax=Coprinopsis marcescibilis TaxID=230819 RepID=A0A5C3KDI6_COPMA|nr:hypothetical protein FA15DRAFT_273524 [Coprinopsis marcescibilis]
MSSEQPSDIAAPPANPLFVFEHSLFVGMYVSGILYGISLLMYIGTMQGLLKKRRISRTSIRARKFFMVYSTVMFLLLTIDIAVNAIWAQLCWINGRDGPGGVTGFIVTQVSVWYQTLGSTTVVIMIFMGDALLLYRMWLIWGQNLYVLVLPLLAYLAAFALALIQLVVAAKPGANFFGGQAINFGTPYYTITIALNVVITCMIAFRLRRLSKTVSRALGTDSSKMYTSVSSMLIESAAPYSLVGIMFLIPYALESQTALSFGQVWAKLTCICPQMIVYRVVCGKAWGKDTVNQAESAVVFGANPGSGGTTLHTNHLNTLEEQSSEKFSAGKSDKTLASADKV